MSDVIYYCTDPRQHEIYLFYKIKMLMSSMCRSSSRSWIRKQSKRVNNSTYHVHCNKIYLFWKINTAPCDYLSCHLFRFPVWSRCFYQLKKDLSDALLAAEHERNNFKAEVSFQTLFHERPKLGVCFSFSLNQWFVYSPLVFPYQHITRILINYNFNSSYCIINWYIEKFPQMCIRIKHKIS